MTATSVTGKGIGDSRKRIAYLSRDLPRYELTKTTTNVQDLITASGGDGIREEPIDEDKGEGELEDKALTSAVDFSAAENKTIFTSIGVITVANTIVETSILGNGVGTKILPIEFFVPGRVIRITVRGIYSANADNPTLRIQCKVGSTVIGDTGANVILNAKNKFFEISEIFTCQTTDGEIFTQGIFDVMFARYPMSSTNTVAIDKTMNQLIDVTATWGFADPENTISATNTIIEILN